MGELTFDMLVEKINTRVPFSFSRFGDGEFNCIFGGKNSRGNIGANCDGHLYYPDLGIALLNVLKSNPKYYMGIQNLAINTSGDKIDVLFKEHNINIEWGNADILHKASIKHYLNDFINALNGNPCNILVAPDFLISINKKFHYEYHISVPEKNAWLNWKQIEYDASKCINRQYKKNNVVVLLMAGMAANVILDHLYHTYGEEITVIDTGSVFDPYVGRLSRKYHNDLKLDF